MARIRTIKPEFPQSETIGRISRDARLLFVQLWTFADDEGRARAAPQVLAGSLYPYDDDARGLIGGWLDELECAGLVVRYIAGGAHYLAITHWSEHQKIDHPASSRIPAPPEKVLEEEPSSTYGGGDSRDLREPSRDLREPSRLDLGPRIKDLGPVPPPTSQGSPTSSSASPPASVASQPPAATAGREGASPQRSDLLEVPEGRRPKRSSESRGSRLPSDWQPSAECRDFAEKLGLDAGGLAESFRDYWRAQPGQRGRKSDWDATWRNWCRRDAPKSPPPSSRAAVLVPARASASSPAPERCGEDHRFGGIPGVKWRRRDRKPFYGPEINGVYLDTAWEMVAGAAGMDPERPPDLRPLAEWLSAGLDGCAVASTIRRLRQRNPTLVVRSLRYFDAAVREERLEPWGSPADTKREEVLA